MAACAPINDMGNVILFDVDGVLANFRKLYVEVASEIIGAPQKIINHYEWESGNALGLTDSEKESVLNILCYEGAALRIEPYEGAIETVKQLHDYGHEIYFVTTPLEESKTWGYDRVAWLNKFFGNLSDNYILTKQKHKVFGHVLIEDKPANLKSWKEAWPNSLPILWAHEYNETMPGIIRTNKWSRLISLIQNFNKSASRLTYAQKSVTIDG